MPNMDTKKPEANHAADTKALDKAHHDEPHPRMTDEHARHLLIALIACDWLVGDKSHYAKVRALTIRLLKSLGDDGVPVLDRLEDLSYVDDNPVGRIERTNRPSHG